MTNLPQHLQGLPKLPDEDLILDTFSNQELREFLNKTQQMFQANSTFTNNPAGTTYLVLGSYEDTNSSSRESKKDRLKEACFLLKWYKNSSTAFLLDELHPNQSWANWYLKFHFTLASIDYCVLVAEDNEGGHELELGEVNLTDTYVAKRDYEHASIDSDIEYDKFDGMMATLFDFLDSAGRLQTWQNKSGFYNAINHIAHQTS